MKFVRSQLFWVISFTFILGLCMSILSKSFSTSENLYNITRNSSFYAIMALGQSWVILTGGIDLSVGSVMALSGISTALMLAAGYSFYVSISVAIGISLLCGLINGILIARFKLSPFIVTLGMLSIARSICLIISGNKMIYSFGEYEDSFLALGSSHFWGLSFSSWIAIIIAIFSTITMKKLVIGRYLYATGYNEKSCRSCGVPVIKTKIIAYSFSAVTAGIAGILTVSWLGSATTGLGTGDELTVIAATVLSGFSLSGGFGTPWAPIAGALLIELVRNSLLLI